MAHVHLVWALFHFYILRPLPPQRRLYNIICEVKHRFFYILTNIPQLNPLHNAERTEHKKKLFILSTTLQKYINILGWFISVQTTVHSHLSYISCTLLYAFIDCVIQQLIVTSTTSAIIYCSWFRELIFVFQLTFIKI